MLEEKLQEAREKREREKNQVFFQDVVDAFKDEIGYLSESNNHAELSKKLEKKIAEHPLFKGRKYINKVLAALCGHRTGTLEQKAKETEKHITEIMVNEIMSGNKPTESIDFELRELINNDNSTIPRELLELLVGKERFQSIMQKQNNDLSLFALCSEDKLVRYHLCGNYNDGFFTGIGSGYVGGGCTQDFFVYKNVLLPDRDIDDDLLEDCELEAILEGLAGKDFIRDCHIRVAESIIVSEDGFYEFKEDVVLDDRGMLIDGDIKPVSYSNTDFQDQGITPYIVDDYHMFYSMVEEDFKNKDTALRNVFSELPSDTDPTVSNWMKLFSIPVTDENKFDLQKYGFQLCKAYENHDLASVLNLVDQKLTSLHFDKNDFDMTAEEGIAFPEFTEEEHNHVIPTNKGM